MKRFITLAVTAAFLLISCGLLAQETILLKGAGATFPEPLYKVWFNEYSRLYPEVAFIYDAVGSGEGIRKLKDGAADFAASDAPVNGEQAGSAQLVSIPTVAGAIVLGYNIPALKGPLKLTGKVIADIFLGEITKWDDPQIASINAGASLPHKNILVVHRSDASGTSYIFTDYLSKVSPLWARLVGNAKIVPWPSGMAASGNSGVSALIKKTPYSIGYLELGYAKQEKIAFAEVRNRNGEFVEPDITSISAAITGDGLSLTDSASQGAYPIVGLTYMLAYHDQTSRLKGKALKSFLNWAATSGQELAGPLYYAPLPERFSKKIFKTIDSIKVP